jgi:hypothetical protein
MRNNVSAPNQFVYNTEYTISQANTWTYITFQVPGCSGGLWPTGTYLEETGGQNFVQHHFDFGYGTSFEIPKSDLNKWIQGGGGRRSVGNVVFVECPAGSTWQMTGEQIEIGEASTPYQNIPFQEHLKICQRYLYNPLYNNVTANAQLAVGQNTATTTSHATFQLPQTMRAVPGLVNLNGNNYLNFSVWDATGTPQTLTALTINTATPQAVTLTSAVALGLVAGGAGMLIASSNAYAPFGFGFMAEF